MGGIGRRIYRDLPGKPPGGKGQGKGSQRQRAIPEAKIRLHRRLRQAAGGNAAQGECEFRIQASERGHRHGNIRNDAPIPRRRRGSRCRTRRACCGRCRKRIQIKPRDINPPGKAWPIRKRQRQRRGAGQGRAGHLQAGQADIPRIAPFQPSRSAQARRQRREAGQPGGIRRIQNQVELSIGQIARAPHPALQRQPGSTGDKPRFNGQRRFGALEQLADLAQACLKPYGVAGAVEAASEPCLAFRGGDEFQRFQAQPGQQPAKITRAGLECQRAEWRQLAGRSAQQRPGLSGEREANSLVAPFGGQITRAAGADIADGKGWDFDVPPTGQNNMRIAQADQPDLRRGASLPRGRGRGAGLARWFVSGGQRPQRGIEIELQPIRFHMRNFHAARNQ